MNELPDPYEVRKRRHADDGRWRLEAWLPGWHWPAVHALEHGDGWLVLVDPKIADLAGLGDVHVSGVEVIDSLGALEWVNLLAALYVKAVAK